MENKQEVTGRLENWVYSKKQNVLIGDLYDDVNGRWEDGTPVKTSTLQPMSLQVSTPKEGSVVNTLNSVYLLGKQRIKEK